MADARGTTVSVRITGDRRHRRGVRVRRVRPDDHLPRLPAAYVETVDDEAGGEADDAERGCRS